MTDKPNANAYVDVRTLSSNVLRQLAAEAEARELVALREQARPVRIETTPAPLESTDPEPGGVDSTLPPHLRGLARTLPPVVPVSVAARVLGVHSKTIRRWIDAGRLVATQSSPCGRVLLTRDALLRLLAKP